MQDYASWVASGATMVAAIMTASNLGTRMTGWGFAVFTLGSVAWAAVGIMTGQTSLAITNGFLLIVNLFGVWRWLGRQARHEQGSATANRNSRRHNVPTLFAAGQLIGAKVKDARGEAIGTVIDAMMSCDLKQLNYVVVGQGGIGGAGETLRALAAKHLAISERGIRCNLTATQFQNLPEIDADAWPETAPVPIAPPLQAKGFDHAKIQHA